MTAVKFNESSAAILVHASFGSNYWPNERMGAFVYRKDCTPDYYRAACLAG